MLNIDLQYVGNFGNEGVGQQIFLRVPKTEKPEFDVLSFGGLGRCTLVSQVITNQTWAKADWEGRIGLLIDALERLSPHIPDRQPAGESSGPQTRLESPLAAFPKDH